MQPGHRFQNVWWQRTPSGGCEATEAFSLRPGSQRQRWKHPGPKLPRSVSQAQRLVHSHRITDRNNLHNPATWRGRSYTPSSASLPHAGFSIAEAILMALFYIKGGLPSPKFLLRQSRLLATRPARKTINFVREKGSRPAASRESKGKEDRTERGRQSQRPASKEAKKKGERREEEEKGKRGGKTTEGIESNKSSRGRGEQHQPRIRITQPRKAKKKIAGHGTSMSLFA